MSTDLPLSHRLATIHELRALMALSIQRLIAAYLDARGCGRCIRTRPSPDAASARLVLSLCETSAAREGFRSLELVSTVAGEPLHRACGFSVIERIDVPTSSAVTVPWARMGRQLPAAEVGA